MDLVADRFAVSETRRVVDLATGEPVVLTITSAGGPHDQRRWAVRCDAFLKLRHRSMAQLVDYGEIGETQRFEAWRCGLAWTGSHAAADVAARRVAAFLGASGLCAGASHITSMRQSPNGPVVLPDATAGYPIADEATVQAARLSLEDCGIVVQPRQAVSALAELFAAANETRPQIAAIWGPPGAGKTTALGELAHLARVQGFVPVDARVLDDPAFRDVVAGRSLFVIADETASGWQTFLTALVKTPKPHVLIFGSTEEVPGVNGMPLEWLTAPALAASVQPRDLPKGAEVRVRRAAARADGVPGRFAEILWPGIRSQAAPRETGRRLLRAAEQPAVYGVEETDRDRSSPVQIQRRSWPAPGELATLRRRVGAACELIDRGRHAPAERQLRQAIGGLARRGDWPHAGQGALALASFLLKRGRARDALAAVAEAIDYWNRAGDETALVESATIAGSAWIDLGRPSDAEPILVGALAAARSATNAAATARAALVLARCAFWQGRYAEADQLVTSARGDDERWRIRAGILQSRIAVGLGDLGRAITTAVHSIDAARTLGDSVLMAAAACGGAFVHLAVGDLDACERDAAECLSAIRPSHDPLRAIRARLLLAESARRRDQRSTVGVLIRRLEALSGTMLPPIVRARVALIKDLVGTALADNIVARHVASTGLQALALFAPLTDYAAHGPRTADPALDDLLEILRLCQSAEDEKTVLGDVCGRLRRQLHASAVGFAAREGGRYVSIASDGRLDVDVAERAITAGIAIAPHRCGDGIEAAVPVKYGGATIGAVAARWTLGSTYDRSGATAALSTAATAAAPMLAAALAHNDSPAPGIPDLIGASAAMADVRLAIERAAKAPFSVLIEGESGSGKELVARALHRRGARRDRPFCTLNCAALPDDLIEAELFGHSRGAFTGAIAERSGVFEEAHGGSLFLDEIGELSPRAQAKLLRVLQEGELRRIGENICRRVDVRIVAATNRDLRAEAAAARFRMDLLYRLDVVRIVVPPLRERREDIALLAAQFWRESASRVGSRATLGAATLAALARYDWPGNVRELQNVLAALAVRTPKRGVVPPTALPRPFTESRTADTFRLDDARRTFEERFVRAALVRAGGHRSRAASELGVTRQGLTKLMMRLGIE